MSKTPCKRSDLTAFISAYSVATTTENKILMGLAGDALNKLLDTITFAEDLAADQAPVAVQPKRQTTKKTQEESGDF